MVLKMDYIEKLFANLLILLDGEPYNKGLDTVFPKKIGNIRNLLICEFQNAYLNLYSGFL
jgi:hypothetical protein